MLDDWNGLKFHVVQYRSELNEHQTRVRNVKG